MKYVIGIDLGTSGVKCLLVDADGNILDNCVVSYKPDFLEGGYVEQDPIVWWESTTKALKLLIEKNPAAKGNIFALSTSGQMHSSVFLDESNNVIRKAILWNDTRTTKQTEEIYEKTKTKENLLSMVYNLALEGFTLPKILWLRENEPENFKKLNKVVMPKDYINFMLSGSLVTEVSDAAGTLLFDVKNNCWSKEMLTLLDLDAKILPEVLPSTGVVGKIKEELYEELGLNIDAKIIAGGADNSCAAVGNGVTKKGSAVVSVGTSGTVVGFLDGINSEVTGKVHLFNYSLEQSFYAMGCMLSAGESLNWLKRTLFEDLTFEDLNSLAEKSPVGSKNLIFLPYLYGERSPHNDPNARGVFFGLNSSTEKGDLIRAVMEGVAFGLKDLYTSVCEFTELDEVYITGGGAKSNIWGQIISDILNTPLKILNISEGPSFGAALIALVGSGICEDFESAKGKSVSVLKTITPSQNAEKYKKYYEIYKQLYKANKELFKQL